jgi:ketosteroid isomerase-like protein
MTIRPPPGPEEFASEPPRNEPAAIAGFETREEMIRAALTMMQMRGEGRFAELADAMTDDAEMVFPGIPGQSPFNGTFKGKEACIAAMKANYTLIEFIDLQARSVLADGDAVIVNWACKMRNRGTGPAVPAEGMARVRFRDRKMCFYGNHLDTAAVAALAQFPSPSVG